ncbi:hypothetical protein ABZ922_31140 [Streptomyces shenzhenensis]
MRAERDDLRNQLQLMARIVQVLEGQLADHAAVPDLTQRRRT